VIHKTIHKYLFKRHEIFYFRWRVTAELQTILSLKEIRFSLRTSSLLVAQARANDWFDLVNHAKLMKSSYQFSEISKANYIQTMKKKISEIQSTKQNSNDSGDVQLIRSIIGGVVHEFDYGDDVEKEVKAAQSLLALNTNATQSIKKSAGITLSEFFKEFLAYKNKLSVDMKESYQLYVRTLIEIMGDKDIGLIEQGDIKNALSDYLKLPKRNIGKYKKISIKVLLEMDIEKKDLLSPKTVSDVKKLLQGIFSYAVERNFVSTSVMNGLNMNLSNDNSYAKYEDHEVLMILNGVNQQKDIAKKWMCWLAAYTGARRGEIIQLRKQDVKFDIKTKRHFLLITDSAGPIKTKNALRGVPIHNELMQEGFLSYVESQNDKLFEGLNADSFTKWFPGFRESLGIIKHDDYHQRKVFHSFRHSFITKSRAVGNQVDKVQQVVGHEKVHFGITDKYSKRYDLYEILDVVDRVSYSEVWTSNSN